MKSRLILCPLAIISVVHCIGCEPLGLGPMHATAPVCGLINETGDKVTIAVIDPQTSELQRPVGLATGGNGAGSDNMSLPGTCRFIVTFPKAKKEYRVDVLAIESQPQNRHSFTPKLLLGPDHTLYAIPIDGAFQEQASEDRVDWTALRSIQPVGFPQAGQ